MRNKLILLSSLIVLILISIFSYYDINKGIMIDEARVFELIDKNATASPENKKFISYRGIITKYTIFPVYIEKIIVRSSYTGNVIDVISFIYEANEYVLQIPINKIDLNSNSSVKSCNNYVITKANGFKSVYPIVVVMNSNEGKISHRDAQNIFIEIDYRILNFRYKYTTPIID